MLDDHIHRATDRRDIPRVSTENHRFDVITNCRNGTGLSLSGPQPGDRGFSQSDKSLIRMHFDDHIRRHRMFAMRRLRGHPLLQRHADGDSFNTGDLHLAFFHTSTKRQRVACEQSMITRWRVVLVTHGRSETSSAHSL